jgi:hypothetical protein
MHFCFLFLGVWGLWVGQLIHNSANVRRDSRKLCLGSITFCDNGFAAATFFRFNPSGDCCSLVAASRNRYWRRVVRERWVQDCIAIFVVSSSGSTPLTHYSLSRGGSPGDPWALWWTAIRASTPTSLSLLLPDLSQRVGRKGVTRLSSERSLLSALMCS